MWNRQTIGKRLTVMNALTMTVMSILLISTLFYSVHTLLSYEAYAEASGVDASSAENETIRTFLNDARLSFYVIAGVSVLAFSFFALFTYRLMMRKTLEPLNELAKTMDSIDPDHLPDSIELPRGSQEVRKTEHAFNRMLQKIDSTVESKKRFAKNAAHELKTPLSAVMTNIEVLKMDEDPSKEDVLEVLELTGDHMDRMHTLVKELLEMHVSTLEKTHFHLRDMTLMDESMHELAEERRMSVELKGDTQLHGSRPLLERALQNIIHNALRYGHEDGHVKITAGERAITIEDDGPGIKSEHIDKIFDPFYRVEPSRSRDYGGTGLGLAIVKEILDRHQMTITVDNRDPWGTVFKIQW